jgi:acyl-CoA hydrolase
VGTGVGGPGDVVYEYRRLAAQGKPIDQLVTGISWLPKQVFSDPNVPVTALFVSAPVREAASQGVVSVASPDNLYAVARQLQQDRYGIDTIFLRTPRPRLVNGQWMVSTGPVADITAEALTAVHGKKGGRILVEYNDAMPWTRGTQFPLHWVHAAWRNPLPGIPEADVAPPTAIEDAAARNAVKFIPPRAMVQVGYGAALESLGAALVGKGPRGMWSEFASDYLLPLLHHERLPEGVVLGFAHGSESLMKAVETDPRVSFASALTVNNPAQIARIPRFVAFNTALQFSLLTGDANATQIGTKIISSRGGQPNFMKNVNRDLGGMSVLVLRSRGGHANEIPTAVWSLDGPTTTPGWAIDVVATEWRAVEQWRLRGPDLIAGRISTAHPLDRMPLARQALRKGLIRPAHLEQLRRSIFVDLKNADEELAAEVLPATVRQGLLTADQAGVIRRAWGARH